MALPYYSQDLNTSHIKTTPILFRIHLCKPRVHVSSRLILRFSTAIRISTIMKIIAICHFYFVLA